MKKYYISSKTGRSGICKYSVDFFELVLKEKGYIFIDSQDNLAVILSIITSQDHVHIEIGIFQKKEIQILFSILKKGYRNVAITLHDPPLLKYPFHESSNPFMNKISKFYDIYIKKFGDAREYMKMIKTIYVLSEKGREKVKLKYGVDNVYYIPHIISEKEIKKSDADNNNFIYFGFIGRNKGIEYSLMLHQRLLVKYPEIEFYIIGTALGREKIFYENLKEKYIANVYFTGYMAEEELDAVFNKATFSLMLFKEYNFFSPTSGSLLSSLKKGKIPFTNNVNTVSEVIENGVNGFFLSGDIKKDVETVSHILDNKDFRNDVKNAIYAYLIRHHTSPAVSKKLKD